MIHSIPRHWPCNGMDLLRHHIIIVAWDNLTLIKDYALGRPIDPSREETMRKDEFASGARRIDGRIRSAGIQSKWEFIQYNSYANN